MNSRISAGNPIANALVVIAGIAIIGVSILLGFLAFLVIGALVILAAAGVAARAWWYNRGPLRRPAGKRPRSGRGRPADPIEGEYHVVDRGRREK